MNTSHRLERAIKKLYLAFHNNELHPECCKSCAVGNILDCTNAWQHLSDAHGSLKLNYLGNVHQMLNRRFNGYSPQELLHLEATFLEACGYELPFRRKNRRPENPEDKVILFQGLSAVIELLCKFDNVPNVMDYTKLFEVIDDKPKHELCY